MSSNRVQNQTDLCEGGSSCIAASSTLAASCAEGRWGLKESTSCVATQCSSAKAMASADRVVELNCSSSSSSNDRLCVVSRQGIWRRQAGVVMVLWVVSQSSCQC